MANEAQTQRLQLLRGGELENYASTASRLILAGRLNKLFPDPFGCSERMRFLSPSLRAGVYDGVMLDRTSGLPCLKDIVTVQVDYQIAAEFLREEEARAAAGRSPTPKIAAKLAYYRKLRQASLPLLTSLDVRLRRVYPERKVAAFEVVFDRYDTAENVFVRYTLLLEQTDSTWGSALLERSGDYTQQTAGFRALMERYAQDDSEITFLLLGKVPGLRLEEVTRARIGPLWSPETPAPPGWFPDDHSDAYVLHLPVDRASVNQDLDLDNDPFSTLFKEFLSDTSRPLVEEAARELGYHVFKDRKFACTPSAEPLLRARLREAGTRNMIYVA